MPNRGMRLRHYFLTYKLVPGDASRVSIENTYGCEHALRVIEASMDGYNEMLVRISHDAL